MGAFMSEGRYFLMGVDPLTLEDVAVYTEDEYEFRWPLIRMSYPEMFSINLFDAMNEFLTSSPQQFDIEIEEAIDLACFYYCDWDSVKAITDDFLNAAVIEEARVSLIRTYGSSDRADSVLQDSIAVMTSALQAFISTVISVLGRVGAPAIVDYGSCYRLDRISDSGDVYFKMRNPCQVFYYLENIPTKQEN